MDTHRQDHRDEPIAIIGTACRFPGGCSSPSKLWDLYKQPRDVLSEIPVSRFNADKFYHPDPSHPGTSNVRHSYLLSEDLRVFDAPFFNLKPSEAISMDPQHRILLEVSYEALESAGLPLPQLQSSSTGVFVGLMSADYSDRLSQDITNVPTYFASGTARSTLSNRVSHAFDLQGPSMTIDTACSSSLVALHQAVFSLRRGESSPAAIVAGTNLLLSPEPYVAGAKLNMLSPSGKSRMWDKAADGYGRGDGFAVLVLKKLSQAIADGDHIECVIRETGVNQDGRTRGITMPSARAQERLIKETYRRAGLDLARKEDRPQYFEAHGTGTPTGDPIEAEAISSVFFGNHVPRKDEVSPLYVGSGKTILGHSEGTAGVAGVLRASLALQNDTILPNMLLNEISPKVAPFYTKLQIVKEAKRWPEPGTGRPKRASVNSFGFGGTNAHAILESFEGHQGNPSDDRGPFILPFNFSAACDSSLKENLLAYAKLLQEKPDINLLDLAWTLDTRRTTLPSRISIAALNRQDLIAKLHKAASSLGNKVAPYRASSTKESPEILAIFTGQGAQWASMGTALLKYEFLVNRLKDLQDSLETLPPQHAPSWSLHEELLKPPESSRIHEAEISQPLCTAIQVLLVDLLTAAKVKISAVIGHSSGEIAAAYAAGFLSARDAIRIAYYRGYFIKHDEVSARGKGAMLAAGVTPSDAQELCDLPTLAGRICIAARNSPTSVTLSGDADAIHEAREILEDEGKFARLLRVDKAYHSHHMVSGAAQYVEALEALDIKVTGPSSQHPKWISSVFEDSYGTVITAVRDLRAGYWGDNMVKPVLFSDAVQHYCEDISSRGQVIDTIIEVGPHPALKKPALETIQSALASDDHRSATLGTLTKTMTPGSSGNGEIPYISTLSRSSNDVEEIAQALGSLWTIFGSNGALDFHVFYSAVHGGRVPQVVKNLPTYSWLHDRLYWHESRHVRALRQGSGSPNTLLGVVCPDSITSVASNSSLNIPKEVRYRNQLHFGTDTELAWLAGHKVQGSVVFPAAGYIAAVMEAVGQMFGRQLETVDLVEVTDFVIKKALVFPDTNSARGDDGVGASGVETLISMRLVEEEDQQLTYLFSFSSDTTGTAAASGYPDTSLTENASGKVAILVNGSEDHLLPPPSDYQPPEGQRFVDVNRHEFYTWARELGYEYDGEFLGLVDTRRRLDQSCGQILVPSEASSSSPLLLHPALLDCAIQAMLLAYCYPGDNRMRTLHMPTKVDRLSIDLKSLQRPQSGNSHPSLPFNASVEEASGDDIVGDAQVCSADRTRTLIQLQGLHITPLVKSSEKTDVKMFLDITWAPERPTSGTISWDDDSDFIETPCPVIPNTRLISLASLTERLAFYYLRNLTIEFPPDKRALMDFTSSHHGRLLDYAHYVVSRVRNGTHPYVPAEAASDPPDEMDIRALSDAVLSQYPSSIDLKVISAIGEGLSSAIRGETNILEVMRDAGTDKESRSTMMDQFYATSLGMPKYLGEIARIASQISHRFAHMNILEIGAGSGATTATVLPALDGSFASYTFSDISSGYFAHAQDRFMDPSGKMLFRVLDIEKDIADQGFVESSYDLIIASLVLHATRDLAATMANVRRLLRPGGYLVLLEVTNNDSLRVGLVSGGLPGWWLGGEHDGRVMSPCVSVGDWERLAVASGGFSPLEAITPHDDAVPVPLSVLAFQAVDDRVRLLNDPLHFVTTSTTSDGLAATKMESLTIIGGTVEVVDRLRELLNNSYRLITHLPSLEDLVHSYKPEQETSLLSLVGLYDDAQLPVFEEFTPRTLAALQMAFQQYKSLLWVTSGARTGDNPYNNMLVGLQRSVTLEMRTGHEEDEPNMVRSRVLDFDLEMLSPYSPINTEEIIAKRLLQIEFESSLQKQLGDGLLWCSEPEQFVCMRDSEDIEHDTVYEIQIPRMRTSKSANARYNSAKRAGMVDDVVLDARATVLSLVKSEDNYTLTTHPLGSPPSSLAHSQSHVTVRLLHSLLQAVPLEPGTAGYLSLGMLESGTDKSELAIVLSESLQSRIMVPSGCVYKLTTSSSAESALPALLSLQFDLLSRRLHNVATATRGSGTLTVLNPGEELGQALYEHSKILGGKVALLTSKPPSTSSGLPWVYLHPRSTRSSIRRLLPSDISVFVDMDPEQKSGGTSAFLHSCLPHGCQQLSRSDVKPTKASLDVAMAELSGAQNVIKSFQAACVSSFKFPNSRYQNLDKPHIVSIEEMTSGSTQIGSRPTVLSWPTTLSTTVPFPIHPASSTIQFSPSKTYWLAGLTSDLGLSLAEWMATRGARHIALSSRNPNIDPRWVSYMMTGTSCSVRIFSNYDATSRDSVGAIHRAICDTMPPIGGVVQGAMILNDSLFLTSNASAPSYFDRFNKVLEPKVQGSLYLDELFSNPSESLDFFIMFSSLAYIVGNRGQSAYTAANAFMASLASNRRRRGLPASVVHLGAIVGPGYVSRELTAEKRAVLHRSGFSFLSEQDFWEIFAEGVIAGKPTDEQSGFEISAGLRIDEEGDGSKTFSWNPIFQHLITKQSGQNTSGEGLTTKQRTTDPLKVRLAGLTSEAEGYEMMLEHFVSKLEGTLALPTNTAQNVHTLVAKTPDELGIDSLVAVDIQSWFRKELAVDVPVMKILNAPTIQHLLSSAWELVDLRKMMPNVPVTPTVKVEGARPSPLSGLDKIRSDMMSSSHLSSGLGTSTPTEWPHMSGLTTPDKFPTRAASEFSESDKTGISTPRSETSIEHMHQISEPPKQDSTHSLQRAVPMSLAQSRFWFLNFLVQDKSAFNVTTLIRLNSKNNVPLDVTRLERAFITVGQRHEAIRTMFFTDPTTKVHLQGVLAHFPLRLEHTILDGHLSPKLIQSRVRDEVSQIRHHVFDLSKGESVKLKLLTVSGAREYYLILGYHHVVMDGISQQVFFSELAKAYETDSMLPPSSWGAKTLQYPDYTLRQMREQEQDKWAEQTRYWQSQFSADDLPARLPRFSPFASSSQISKGIDSDVPSFSSHVIKGPMDANLKAKIDEICRKFRASPSHFYLAVFRAFLFRHAIMNEEASNTSMDMCIGVGDAGRKDPDVQDSLGLFLNLLPLRFRKTTSDTIFADSLLPETKRISDSAFANSRVPIDLLLQSIAKDPKGSGNGGLFQAFFNYRPPGIQNATSFLGCDAQGEMISAGGNSYDVSVDVTDSSPGSATGATITMAVNSEVYTAENAEVMRRSYLALLEEFAKDPQMRIDQSDLYLEQDVKEAIELGRGEQRDDRGSRWPATVVHQIDNVVARHQDRVAINTVSVGNSNAGVNMTYRQMANRIHHIASHLTDHLQTPGTSDAAELHRIAVFQAPGADWVCSMLAILRIGAICVPLESSGTLPDQRITRIIRDARVRSVLVDNTTKQQVENWTPLLQAHAVTLIDVASITSDRNAPAPPIQPQAQPLDTAIITYTSGSTTGTPRGVPTRHESLTNFLEHTPRERWWPNQDPSQLTMLQQSSFAFDMAIAQILACLTHGGKLVIPTDAKQRQDPAALCEIILSRGVTFTMATPTEYAAWLRIGGDNIRHALAEGSCHWVGAMSGGEALTPAHVGLFRGFFPNSSNFRLINSYGPCETTFACAEGVVSLDNKDTGAGMSVLPNYTVRIVDQNLNPVPCGVLGQIIIGGAGVAKGYDRQIHSDKFSSEKRYCSPFFIRKDWTTEHLTGDLGRFDNSGNLTIHGRIMGSGGTQVKVGGVRMDLIEIESILLETLVPFGVSEVVVSCRDQAFLAAFVVLSSGVTPIGIAEEKTIELLMRKMINEASLPQNMRPSVVRVLGAIPKTISNKIDRAKLDALPLERGALIDADNLSQNAIEVQDQGTVINSTGYFEDKLLALWKELLPGIPSTSSLDKGELDFFHAGGNSLALLSLQALIKERLNITVSIAELFGSTSLVKMANLLKEKASPSHDKETSVDHHESIETSPRTNSERMDMAAVTKPTESRDTIDWDQETSIDDLASQLADRHLSRPGSINNPPQVVALTGATGYLGKEILRQLVDNPTITHIHCLAVRALPSSSLPPSESTTTTTISENGTKITYRKGDLTKPNLGLSSGEASEIFDSLDAIIHAGADVSFMKSYHALKTSNLYSTQEIARLAIPRGVTVHYISTAGVAVLATGTPQADTEPEVGEVSLKNFPPTAQQLESGQITGYIATKWASEVFLGKVSEKYGLPVVVHRPSYITAPTVMPSSSSSAPNPNSAVTVTASNSNADHARGEVSLDLTENMINYAKKTRTVPDLSHWTGYFDSISVEKATSMIIEEVSNGSADAGDKITTSIKYVYESGETVIAVRDLGTQIMGDVDEGLNFQVLRMEEWVDVIAQAGMNPLLVAYLRQSVVGRRLAFPRLVRSV